MPDDVLELDVSGQHNSNAELREAIERLTHVVNELTAIFKTASADIHAEADSDLGKKMDILIRQNQDIAKALLTVLDVQNEHLQKLSERSESSSRSRQAYVRTKPAQMIRPAVIPAAKLSERIISVPIASASARPIQMQRHTAMATQPSASLPPISDLDAALEELPDFSDDKKMLEKKGFGMGK